MNSPRAPNTLSRRTAILLGAALLLAIAVSLNVFSFNPAPLTIQSAPTGLRHSPFACDAIPPSSLEVASGKGAKVLVTGVAGFIASHVARYCAEELGMQVIGVDDMSGGFDYNIPSNIVFVRGDLKDDAFVAQLFDKHGPFKFVYHLGAYAAEGLSHFIRKFNYQNNLVASVRLLNHAVNTGTEAYVFTSSIAVYGAGQTPMTEDMTPEPEDPYGVSKYAMELDLRAAHEMFGIDYVIFRPHNVYGPGQNIADRYRNVIGIFMRQALAGQEFTIFGDGSQTRSFSYIDDVAPYIALSPLIKAARNQVFNVGADKPYTLNELAASVSRAMNVPLRVKHLAKRNEVDHAEASHAKLSCVFRPEREPVSLDAGLAKMAEWVERLKSRFEPVVFSNIEVRKNMPPSWNVLPEFPFNNKLKICYFGVTHHKTVDRALAVDATWGKRIKSTGLPWYSDKPDSRVKDLTVVTVPEGSDYSMLTYRVNAIWKHAVRRFPPTMCDWYARVWDDDYVITENIEAIVASTSYKPSDLVEIGDRLFFPASSTDYIGGGPGSLTSRALAEAFVTRMHECPNPPEKEAWIEDLNLSKCKEQVGGKLVWNDAFFEGAPKWATEHTLEPSPAMSISYADLACRRKISQPPQSHPAEPHQAVLPATFHYVSAGGQELIEKALYEMSCEEARRKDATLG